MLYKYKLTKRDNLIARTGVLIDVILTFKFNECLFKNLLKAIYKFSIE